jgi:hypothetical protein
MDAQRRSSAGSWVVTAVGGGFGIAGAGVALAAFALRTQRLVLSSRTLYAILGLLVLFGITMTALVKRLAGGQAEQTAPQSAEPSEPSDPEALTRRVRLLRGTDDL